MNAHCPITRRMLLALAIAAMAAPGRAQTRFPDRPVRLVVPAVAGSSADVLARLLGEQLTTLTGQPWIVENKPGAGGIIGSDAVAKAPPTGHTLLFTANNFVISPAMYPTPYDPLRDFEPVSLVTTAPNVLFIHKATGVRNMADLVALARRTPEGINYGAPFIGTSAHLVMEMLKRAARINLVHVPARGTPQAFNEALAGRVPLVIGNYSDGGEYVKAGLLTPIAVVGPKRTELLPEVPTLVEQGYPDFDLLLWFGLLAPARTPASVVQQLNTLVGQALASPQVTSGLTARGFEAAPTSPADFAALMRRELPLYAKVVREAGVKP